MTGCQILLLLFCAVHCLDLGYAVPIAEGLDEIPHQMGSLPGYAVFLISAAAILLLGYVVIGCVCCPNHNIKALSYQNGFPVSRLNENSLQFENPSEFAIFPPHSAVIDLQPVGLSYPTFEDKVTFEPLPDILPRKLSGQSAACSSRPAHFRALLKNKVSLHDWFDDPNSNFPRDQLQYIRELGCGWFGRVVEGEASQINNSEEKTAVLVKILREEASPSEHLHFLHEVRPYRDLSHPNVVRLLGRCLESDPFLLIMEHSISDLKTFLVQHENKDNFIKNGMPLQMACNIASGLKCLHENGFTHMDLAAHNCFVCKDFTVKVGDYGISFDKCREDYYCLGGIALPIRWCSPETLLCTDATIETKEITKEANVWAFGIILWEIFELGKLPYEELTNEEVLQKVLIEKTMQLSAPSQEFPVKEELHLIMKECWKPAHLRPSMEKVEKFLTRLYNDRHNLKTLETSFEERWNSLPPKTVETKLLGTELMPLKFENDFSDKSDSHNYSSDGERFSSFEMSYDMCSKSIGSHLSPSLRVLNGSIDELTENDVCLNSVSLGCEKSTADAVSVDSDVPQLEDDQGNQVRDIVTSDTVRDLDLVLANTKPDISRQTQKLQLHGKKNVNPFISEDCTEAVSKDSITKIGCCDAKTLPNLNVLKTLDDNSNELGLDSENLNRVHANETDEPEMMSVENSPDSVNAKRVLDFCDEENEVIENVALVISAPEAFSDDKVQTNSSKQVNNGLSAIPDIIIHESASAIDSSHDENENMIQDSSDQVSYSESARPFRFVFKDESVPSADKSAVKSSEDTSGSQDTPNATDSSLEKFPDDLKSKTRSQRLTSTPVKSEHDINLNYSSSFADDEDSANVFYDNFQDVENNSPVTEEYFSGSCDILECTPASQSRNSNNTEAKNSHTSFCHEAASKTEPTVEIEPNPFDVKESTASIGFTSALSTFDEKDDENVTKILDFNDAVDLLQSNSSVSASNNQTVVVSIPLPIFNSEVNDHNSSVVESKHSPAPEIDCFQKSEFSPEKNNLHKSDPTHPEDVASVDFGEPVTPEVSFNVSSCSYGNDFRSMSTDSPGVSSSNKDLDYDSPVKKYDPNMHCEGGLATTPECLVKDVDCHKHTELLDSGTTQDFRTLDSEASGSEYLESFSPDVTPDSFGHSDEKRMESVDNMRPVKSSFKSSFQSTSAMNRSDLLYDEDDLENDSESDTNAYKSKSELRLHPYDEVIVEDLETGEQTIITESFSACDDYDNSADSDEILKINIETDEAIIVDSSEALIGFVPSRSIELLQECEIIPTLNPSFTVEDEKESEDSNHFDGCNSASSSPVAMQSANSPCESPESIYPFHQPYRNFSLQNEVIEEEITDEIATPSSIHSTASFSSNEGFVEEEKMSQSSESYNQDVCETSVLPSVDHFYDESNDGSRSDISNSDCSPAHSENGVVNNIRYVKDYENNRVSKELQDVMYSKQPTQSVCWHSDETLNIERDSPVILEGREILAGGFLETRGMSVKDITATLNQLDAEDCLNRQTLNHLSISHSPSPYSSLESSPCREAYTPDFESDSDDGGTSCSSTSGSFECIHNKFKDAADISKAADESEPSDSSREQSPKKIFSKTWDCHATPSKSVLVTPEKKFNSLRKSVSFHEEDPQVVFEYPPASDSSEDDHVQNEITSRGIAYHIFADWELHAPENEEPEIEEVLEIEELESEPYVRRPTYGIGASLGPMNRPMYSFTSGFSDDDMDLSEPLAMPSKSIAPSNSPEEGKHPSLSGDQISELIKNQLNNLALEESRLKWMQDELDQQSHEFSYINSALDRFPTSVHSSEGNGDPVSEQDVLIDEFLPENSTARREVSDSELIHQGELKHTLSTEEQTDGNLISLDVKEDIELTDELNDIDSHLNSVDTKSNESLGNNESDFEVKTVNNFSEKEKTEMDLSDLLINFEAEMSYSPPAEFTGAGPIYKYMVENDGFPVLENKLSSTYPSNFLDFESTTDRQNLSFDSLPQETDTLFRTFPILDASDSKKSEFLVDTSTAGVRLVDFSDDFVPYKNTCDGDKEQRNLSEIAPLKFIEGNVRPNSAKNKLNCNKEFNLDSLQNDSYNELSFNQISQSSDTYYDMALDSSDMKGTLDSNLEKFADDEIKETGSAIGGNLEMENNFDADSNMLSRPTNNSDPAVSCQTQAKSLDSHTSERTESSGVADCEFLDQLDENVSISEKTQMETVSGTAQKCNNSSNGCISLVENTTENHTGDGSERSLSDKAGDSIPIRNHEDVESSLPKTKECTEIISNDSPFQEKDVTEKAGNVTSSELEMENSHMPCSSEEKVTENLEINQDKNCTDNSHDLSASKVTDESGIDISSNHIEDISSNGFLSDPENEINVTDSEHAKAVKSDSLNENHPSDDKNLSEKENLHKNETNLLASNSDLGNESALNCADLTKTLEATGKKTELKKELLEPLPQIIVTPASESEVEDELEEYLRDQLEFFHGPSITEGEDFSVTSQFSVRPFEDVFGSHGASHNSGGYIEAFNFEFDSGDFFEDFIDDYPTEMSNNRRLPLDNGNYQWWESPDAPPMIEKSSEEDDSTSKSETSPLYYSSKDATHL
ncbi:Serine/threonine-protein kinase LMTK3 [Araneus ventricosus]|uniref:Serine/threonine-protein kinase LMTK3 n=1 Tax=Araneus ventricosus TaxID=182803 RepID=A0A4Y2KXC7_ARAVE|nr:Serine/threonine-protein kinase LMTK3 [Araneus ventricosus]